MKYISKIRVRYADTDKMGIVYNGNYFAYFEVGRTELMRAYGLPYTVFEDAGYLLPLTEAKAEYKIPALYDDMLEIEAELQFEGKPTVRFDYTIKKDGITLATGYTTHSFVKRENMKPVKPPKMFLEIINNSKEPAL